MKRTILIVDAEADLAAGWARLLRRRGWRVVTAATCEAALVAVGGTHRPILAIVDRHLSDGDGFDVLHAACTTGTPVIMITGQASNGARRLALDEGAAGFLGKPFSTQALVDLVHSVVGPPDAAR
jgi:DNA-binding response OmpR family regulator